MKLIAFLPMILALNIVQAQNKVKTWTIKEDGFTYKLPDTWRTDPFSSSSVCDCPGRINDNGEWDSLYLGMVTYISDSSIINISNRSKVWDYQFNSTEKGEEIVINNIKFIKKKGTMNDSDEINSAWQFVSVEDSNKKQKNIIIYFWGNLKVFSENENTFNLIIKSMKRK